MNTVKAIYISFDNQEDVIKEQEKLINLPVEEMILEFKRLCLDVSDWEHFSDTLIENNKGYSHKTNRILSADEYLISRIETKDLSKQNVPYKNFQIYSNWERLKAILYMRKTFANIAYTLCKATSLEGIAVKYNEYMGMCVYNQNDSEEVNKKRQLEYAKEFSLDNAFYELRKMVNNIKKFYGTNKEDVLSEETVMNFLEQYKPELEEILTGAKSVNNKYSEYYNEIYGGISYILDELKSQGTLNIPAIRSEFFKKFDIARDSEKEETNAPDMQNEQKKNQPFIQSQNTEEMPIHQKFIGFVEEPEVTQPEVLEILTSLGRYGMKKEAEKQIVNVAESKNVGKANEGVNRIWNY